MTSTNHLREINDDRVSGLAMNEDVEFVEVYMDKTGLSEAEDQCHKSGVEIGWRVDVVHLPSR